ncbi:hypothetical protein Pcinc_025786 [Petrolisthes cinctipes]|uniref:Uncharacterized protein n=1 Tax=Petrolisthes cinctipes TaxID=88211 RepID=A0AAE1F7A0_PETCI|nr:hypothetical protein Pcinc_025786 [Petrolisthes cinctipes]
MLENIHIQGSPVSLRAPTEDGIKQSLLVRQCKRPAASLAARQMASSLLDNPLMFINDPYDTDEYEAPPGICKAVRTDNDIGDTSDGGSVTTDLLQLLVRANSDAQFLRRVLVSGGKVLGVENLLGKYPPHPTSNTGYTSPTGLPLSPSGLHLSPQQDTIMFSSSGQTPAHPPYPMFPDVSVGGVGQPHTATRGQHSLPIPPPWTSLVPDANPLSSLLGLHHDHTLPFTPPIIPHHVPPTQVHPAHLHKELGVSESTRFLGSIPSHNPLQPQLHPTLPLFVNSILTRPVPHPTSPSSLSFTSKSPSAPPLMFPPPDSTTRPSEEFVGDVLSPPSYPGLPLRPPKRYRSSDGLSRPHNTSSHTSTHKPSTYSSPTLVSHPHPSSATTLINPSNTRLHPTSSITRPKTLFTHSNLPSTIRPNTHTHSTSSHTPSTTNRLHLSTSRPHTPSTTRPHSTFTTHLHASSTTHPQLSSTTSATH